MKRLITLVVIFAVVYGGRNYVWPVVSERLAQNNGSAESGEASEQSESSDEEAVASADSASGGMLDSVMAQFRGLTDSFASSGSKEEEAPMSQDLTLMKFGANWCGPCRMMDKELETYDRIAVKKIDVDENPGLARQYKVSGIPKLVLVKNGRVLSEREGYHTSDQLDEWITEVNGNLTKVPTSNVGFSGGSVQKNPFAQ